MLEQCPDPAVVNPDLTLIDGVQGLFEKGKVGVGLYHSVQLMGKEKVDDNLFLQAGVDKYDLFIGPAYCHALTDGACIDKDFVRKKTDFFSGNIGSPYLVTFQLVVQKPLQSLAQETAAQIDHNIHAPLCGV